MLMLMMLMLVMMLVTMKLAMLMVMMLGMSSTLNNSYVITIKLKDLGSQKQQHKPPKFFMRFLKYQLEERYVWWLFYFIFVIGIALKILKVEVCL